MTNAGLLAQGGEGITAKGTCQVIGRDLLVGASADPRLRNVAMSAVLQFLYEIAEASAQHRFLQRRHQADRPVPQAAGRLRRRRA